MLPNTPLAVKELRPETDALLARPGPSMSQSEAIRIMCPNLTCRKILAVPPAAREKTVRCKACGTNIRVPAKPAAPETPEHKRAV